jgi:chromosome segregation ATPase
MKRALTALLVFISLGLCSICLVQWQREFRLRETITSLTNKLIEENKQRIAAEEKVQQYSQEIERLNGLRMDIEAKLLTTTEELRDRTDDQSARGYSIAILMNETLATKAELKAYKNLAGKGSDTLKKHNATVAEQNSAIEKANAALKQLARERDEAILKLNARTQEFNELVEKYNKLSR